MSQQALLIFAKNLELGKVKTRIAASFGNKEAISIYKYLLEHTAKITESLQLKKIVFYSNYLVQNDCWNKLHFNKTLQQGNNLGERMQVAFSVTFQNKYKQVVLIGTDCPYLTSEIIAQAFEMLNGNDVVIGPAKDGGYYLIGMNQIQSEIFKNIPWSTEIVLKETIKKCAQLQLKYALLPILSDIDDAEDWTAYQLQKQLKRC